MTNWTAFKDENDLNAFRRSDGLVVSEYITWPAQKIAWRICRGRMQSNFKTAEAAMKAADKRHPIEVQS